jgi:hypothetical protein
VSAVVIAIEYAAAAIFIIPMLFHLAGDGRRKESSPTVRSEPPFVRVLRRARRPERLEAYHVAAIASAPPEQRGANVMGYSDMPFSITSKFSVPGGAEHLVTLRATNAQDFKIRLQEADQIFPTAGFLTWLETGRIEYGEPEDDPNIQPQITPELTEETVARLKAKANAQAAYARAQKNVARMKANGNGNGQPRPTTNAQPDDHPQMPDGTTPFEPRCPDHCRASKSGFGPTGSLYCPTLLEDGSYCKWRYNPKPPVRQAVPANVN